MKQKEIDDKENMMLQLQLKEEERLTLDRKIKKLANMILNSSTQPENPRKRLKVPKSKNITKQRERITTTLHSTVD